MPRVRDREGSVAVHPVIGIDLGTTCTRVSHLRTITRAAPFSSLTTLA